MSLTLALNFFPFVTFVYFVFKSYSVISVVICFSVGIYGKSNTR